MAEKKIMTYIKLQVPAGAASPSPPVGPALGQHGVNLMDFCNAFNSKTNELEKNLPVPVVITVYEDRSFDFIVKTTPASVLLKKAAGLSKGSPTPNSEKVGKVSRKQLEEIADATTMIEKKQGLEAERRGVIKGLEEVFQEKRSYRWFIPLKNHEGKYYFPKSNEIFKVWGVMPTVMTIGISIVWLYWCDIIVRLLVIMSNKKK